MPLVPGNNQKAISANISELVHNGSLPRPRKQIIAIALAEARRTGNAPKGSRFNREHK